jgi:hypothetical protein
MNQPQSCWAAAQHPHDHETPCMHEIAVHGGAI